MFRIKLFPVICLFFVLEIAAQNSDNKLNLEVFEIKKTSIRAIEVINETTVWFAGANGKFGRIINSEIQIDSIIHDDKAINFRSIASNGEAIYILGIEDPALLYQINPKEFTKKQPKLVYQESHKTVFYDSMTFFDKKNGIAIGDPTENCMSVIITSDGGNSWKKISCAQLPKSIEGEGAFAASDSNVDTYKKTAWMVTGGKTARLYKSTDYGNNWKVYDTPIVQGQTMTGIFTVAFENAKNGIIMGGNWEDKPNTKESKALTTDGGITWQLLDPNKIPGYISCVKYVPGTKGKQLMAVSTEGIYSSQDAGNNWQKLSDDGYFSIEFVNNKTAWLSGHEKIAKLSLN